VQPSSPPSGEIDSNAGHGPRGRKTVRSESEECRQQAESVLTQNAKESLAPACRRLDQANVLQRSVELATQSGLSLRPSTGPAATKRRPTRERTTSLSCPDWKFRGPKQLIGSIRRECLDHMVVFGEVHLRRILRSYARYYNDFRTHRSLDKDAPVSRPVQRTGSIKSSPILGGLHHHYARV
jgi:hypothetical protein